MPLPPFLKKALLSSGILGSGVSGVPVDVNFQPLITAFCLCLHVLGVDVSCTPLLILLGLFGTA